ncbi:MAG: xanthine dehydrogenase family protein subunit M [Burkholderiales bacterium]
MHTFSYVKAKSLKEAGDMLAAHADAKLLAGGMTLIPTLKARLAQPSHLIDISGIAELTGIDVKDGKLTIGAGTKHVEVARSAVVKKAIPALAYLANQIGDPQVRNRGTIGGSLANNDPAADYPSAALAVGATIVTNKREIAADDFFQGMFSTALGTGEMIVKIVFPVPAKAAYEKFPHPASGYAMAGSFISQTAKGVRVAITGAGPGVFRWKEAEAALGKKMNAAAVEGINVDSTDLNEDMHGTREYRANLAKVMTKRAVAKLSGK